MDFLNWTNGVRRKMFEKDIKKNFEVDSQVSSTMRKLISKYNLIASGKPPWENQRDKIRSYNFAAQIDNEVAKLVTLDMDVKFPDTARGKELEKQWKYIEKVITDKVSCAVGNCGIMFKPNGKNTDYIEAGYFIPTETDSNGDIFGCVFISFYSDDKYTYYRLEQHKYEDTEQGKVYQIINKAYKKDKNAIVSSFSEDFGREISLSDTKWSEIAPEVTYYGVEMPLYAYFSVPVPNIYDHVSPLGLPIWHNCLGELEDLDIRMCRMSLEDKNSKHIMFTPESAVRYASKNGVELEEFVKSIELGDIGNEQIHEHIPTLLTESRIAGINATLSMISTKIGFSQGFFVLDRKTGNVTATQVESDDQETIDTINDIRDQLEMALKQLFYGLNVMLDIYTTLPAEKWETLEEQIVFSFRDFSKNPDEDRARAYQLTQNGYYPKWYYLVKNEGYTEEEAKALVAEAENKQQEPDLLFNGG